MSASYNRRAQVARQRAYRRLADSNTTEFERLHDEERARVGLEPPDPSKWQTHASSTNENSGATEVDPLHDTAAPTTAAS